MKMDPGFLLRIFQTLITLQLTIFLFQSILQRFQFIADIDLFASHFNKQLSKYVSWYPDPDSVGVDAFNLSRTSLKFYTFPPVSLVAKSISKIIQEKASGIMVIPWWPTQNWFLIMMEHLRTTPSFSRRRKPH